MLYHASHIVIVMSWISVCMGDRIWTRSSVIETSSIMFVTNSPNLCQNIKVF